MSDAIVTEVENIADAVKACDTMARDQGDRAGRLLSLVMFTTLGWFTLIFVSLAYPFMARGLSDQKTFLSDTTLYVFLAIYILTFSVLMAVYRMHMREVSRLQQSQVGFLRIRVAGSNKTEGYQTEVRIALTRNAFVFGEEKIVTGRIKSPIEGHPGSDFGAAVLNKVLDGVDVVKKKAKRPKKPAANSNTSPAEG